VFPPDVGVYAWYQCTLTWRICSVDSSGLATPLNLNFVRYVADAIQFLRKKPPDRPYIMRGDYKFLLEIANESVGSDAAASLRDIRERLALQACAPVRRYKVSANRLFVDEWHADRLLYRRDILRMGPLSVDSGFTGTLR
jgi:hypothetical protein